MNNSYTPPKARLGEPVAKRFNFRSALVAYLTAATTFATLIIWLGWLVSGQFPTAGGYWILWPYALISSVLVALIGGKLAKGSLFAALGVGVLGSLSLLTVTSVAVYFFGVFYRAA